MNKFREKFYNYLSNGQGFYMQNYFSDSMGRDNWIAIKEFQEGDFVVIIVDNNEELDYSECIKFLNDRGKNYKLNKIILCEEIYVPRQDDAIPKMIFNIKENRIIFCENGLEGLANMALSLNSKPTKRSSAAFKAMPVTLGLIAINIIMYIISAIMAGNIWDIDVYTLVDLGAKFGPYIDQGEWFRLITCNFLHGGLIHLAFNMYALYILGPQMENILGRAKYIILYFVTGLASSILSYIVLPNTVSIGASGAIFGLLGAMLLFAIKNRKRDNKGALKNLLVIIGLNVFIGATMPGIDMYGHIGGLVSGILVGSLLFINKKVI